jgi:hypothetical protein
MADGFDLRVDTRELEAALERLPMKLAGKILGRALAAGGAVMLDAVVDETPERTDAETPDGNSLAPGMLKAAMTMEVNAPNADGLVKNGRGSSRTNPNVKVGPQKVGKANKFGRVAYWVNNGWTLTGHASRKDAGADHGKRGWKKGRQIRPIAGQHFLEKAFDKSANEAVDVFLDTLARGLFDEQDQSGISYPDHNSLDVEF